MRDLIQADAMLHRWATDGDDEVGHRTYFSSQLVGAKFGDRQRSILVL